MRETQFKTKHHRKIINLLTTPHKLVMNPLVTCYRIIALSHLIIIALEILLPFEARFRVVNCRYSPTKIKDPYRIFL